MKYPLKVFYDGSCILCSTEMERYRRRDRRGNMAFIDISSPDFRPEEYGKPHGEFMRKLHVMDAEGRFYSGVDAFPLIWLALPPSRVRRTLARLIMLPVIRSLAWLFYKAFARLRGYLPLRRRRRRR